MFRYWQNISWPTRIAMIFGLLVFLFAGLWFSDTLPGWILDYHRSDYQQAAKDEETGFPSRKFRDESGGMGWFIRMAFWYEIFQPNKARDMYLEGIYRYGWTHPRAPEAWIYVMELRFRSNHSQKVDSDAQIFYYKFAEEWQEKFPDAEPLHHPDMKKQVPYVDKLMKRRGMNIRLPVAGNNYVENNPVNLSRRKEALKDFYKELHELDVRYNINPTAQEKWKQENEGDGFH